MFLMYSVVEFDDMNSLLDHKVELEEIFKDKIRYVTKFDIEINNDKFTLRSKIATICPN